MLLYRLVSDLAALDHARLLRNRNGLAESDGPTSAILTVLLHMGQSGMMAGALDRTTDEYTLNSENSLIFL